MDIKNFSEFLFEKEKDDKKVWDPSKGVWFFNYISQISGKEVELTEEKLLKLTKNIDDIDTSSKWEQLYRFAKYCLDRKEKELNSDAQIQEIKDTKIGKKTIEKILSSDIENSEITGTTRSLYETIGKITGNGLDYEKTVKKLSTYPKYNKPIFDYEEDVDPEKKKVEDSKSEWKLNNQKSWTIPVNPNRISALLVQSEMCIRYSLACIDQIANLSISANTGEKEKLEGLIGEKGTLSAKIKSIKDTIVELIGEGEEGEGSVHKFWYKIYPEKKKDDSEESSEEDTKKSAEEDTKKPTEEEIKEFIKNDSATEKTNLTSEKNEAILTLFSEAKELIKQAKQLADDGKMSQAEWEDNIKEYSKDDSGSVKVGEGLKSTMYLDVKDGFDLLQSAIDNYSTGGSEKNALDQYLKNYKEVIQRAKVKYSADI